ncbi:hypothetical protein ACZ91_30775 [Streptomyces regensis]|nr:hypothetical protein ACZ91_30775 [Streptomyces regensis]
MYGSEDEFDSYWDQHELQGWRSASVPNGANDDGSVDVHVQLDFGDGLAPYVVRVVNMGGDLRLDGDTRPTGAAAQ